MGKISKKSANKQRNFYLTKGGRHDIINKSLRGELERDKESQKISKNFRKGIDKEI